MAGLTLDDSGNLYLAGSIRGRVDLDGQILDAGPNNDPVPFILALDGNGAVRWRYSDTDGLLEIRALHAHAGRLAVVGDHEEQFMFAGQLHGPVGFSNEPFILDFGLDGHQHWALTLEKGSADDVVVDDAERVTVVGNFAAATLQVGTVILQRSDQTDINIFAGSVPEFLFLAVLDANDGHPIRANAFGAPETFLNLPRLSFGPTGLRLMSVSTCTAWLSSARRPSASQSRPATRTASS